jgi:hypothetical protein
MKLLLHKIKYCNEGTLAGQPSRQRQSKPVRPARDDGHLILKSFVHEFD